MKTFIFLAALIAFVACYDPLSDEVSRTLDESLLANSIILFSVLSLLTKSIRKQRHGRLDVTFIGIKTLV